MDRNEHEADKFKKCVPVGHSEILSISVVGIGIVSSYDLKKIYKNGINVFHI